MTLSSSDIFVLDAARTPVGSPHKSLKDFSAAQLAGLTIKTLVKRNERYFSFLDEIILGNVVSAGTGQNMARQAALSAGVDKAINAYVVNSVCGASLQSVILGSRAIHAGEARLVLAGGSESASQCPYFLERKEVEPLEKSLLKDSLSVDGLLCHITGKRMGDLVESMAKRHGISRKDQDVYAFESHKKACLAQTMGRFQDEIIKMSTSQGKVIEKDDRPRRNIDLEKLSHLPGAFERDGMLTAGNSSVPCDGASAVILSSRKFLEEHKLVALSRILGYASFFSDPKDAFETAPQVVQKLLEKTGLALADIDLFEICEAFAAQALFVKDRLKIPDKKFNIHGGDLALGHPLGSTGTRMLVTLMNSLRQNNLQRGLVAVSFGSGGALAVLIENMK